MNLLSGRVTSFSSQHVGLAFGTDAARSARQRRATTWFGFDLISDSGRQLYSNFRAANQAEAVARLLERGGIVRYRLAEIDNRRIEGLGEWVEVGGQ